VSPYYNNVSQTIEYGGANGRPWKNPRSRLFRILTKSLQYLTDSFWSLVSLSVSIGPRLPLYLIVLSFVCKTRMWANAKGDGRSAEYRWRSLFNAAKFG